MENFDPKTDLKITSAQDETVSYPDCSGVFLISKTVGDNSDGSLDHSELNLKSKFILYCKRYERSD